VQVVRESALLSGGCCAATSAEEENKVSKEQLQEVLELVERRAAGWAGDMKFADADSRMQEANDIAAEIRGLLAAAAPVKSQDSQEAWEMGAGCVSTGFYNPAPGAPQDKLLQVATLWAEIKPFNTGTVISEKLMVATIDALMPFYDSAQVPDMWPKDLTICQRCKRDMLEGNHALDYWGKVVCLKSRSIEPAPAPIEEVLREMKPYHTPLSEKAKEAMSEFDKGFPYDGSAEPAPQEPQPPPDHMRGFSLWLCREDWGFVTDGLMLEREKSLRRKSDNSESTSDERADACAAVIIKINQQCAGLDGLNRLIAIAAATQQQAAPSEEKK
jgi:hypothetical protein